MADNEASSRAASNRYVLLISVALAIVAAAVLIIPAALANEGLKDSALLFVGLLILSIFGFLMAAAIFKGLGYNDLAGDAFALPTGSIRALLAIAVMMLLVIFDLPLIRPESGEIRVDSQPLQTLQVACSAVSDERRRYASAPVMVIVDETRCTVERISPSPSPSAASAGPVRNTTATATLTLYRRTTDLSAAQLDLGKQTLTAIITLLTTIIGFYFGSATSNAEAKTLARALKADTPLTARDSESK